MRLDRSKVSDSKLYCRKRRGPSLWRPGVLLPELCLPQDP